MWLILLPLVELLNGRESKSTNSAPTRFSRLSLLFQYSSALESITRNMLMKPGYDFDSAWRVVVSNVVQQHKIPQHPVVFKKPAGTLS